MCRVTIAEAAMFPEGLALYFDVDCSAVHGRLGTYLKADLAESLATGQKQRRLL